MILWKRALHPNRWLEYWHLHYAWWPVLTEQLEWVWLETVMRRQTDWYEGYHYARLEGFVAHHLHHEVLVTSMAMLSETHSPEELEHIYWRTEDGKSVVPL